MTRSSLGLRLLSTLRREADYASSLWITTVCLAAVAGVVTVVVMVSSYGRWVYSTSVQRLAVSFFFVAASVLAALVGGTLLWIGLRVLDWWSTRVRPVWFLVVPAMALVGWNFAAMSGRANPAYRSPGLLLLIGFGLLFAAVAARGRRRWNRCDVLVSVLTFVFLIGSLVWINLLALASVTVSEVLERGIPVAIFGLMGVSLLLARLLGVSAEPQPSSRSLRVFLFVALGAALVAVPAYRVARSGAEVATAAASEPIMSRSRGPGPRTADPRSQLNIVLISLDTLRADHLGLYGYHRNTSPNIDRFFADAGLFANAYAQSPWTLPTHMSMMTGLQPSTHGSRIHPRLTTRYYIDALPDSAVTVAELLREVGYATGGFTGGGFLDSRYRFDQGFEEFGTAGTRMEDVLGLALPWLQANRDRPFFLFLHSYDIHHYDPQKFYDDIPDDNYKGRLVALRADYPRSIEWEINTHRLTDLVDSDVRFLKFLYDSEIRGVDEQLQRLFDMLIDFDLLRTTAVILTSDHGEAFGEHGGDVGHSRSMYETVVQVPLLVRIPGLTDPVPVQSPVQTIDLAPTILDLAELPPAPRMPGLSLLPALRGTALPKRTVVIEADDRDTQVALVVEGYKYINHRTVSHDLLELRYLPLTLHGIAWQSVSDEELYDLEGDPGELNNRIEDYPTRAKEYHALLFSRVEHFRSLGGDSQLDPSIPPEDLIQRLRSLGYVQ